MWCFGGIGLGFVISFCLVEMMGGKFDVVSVLGCGLIFFFIFMFL